MPDKKDDQIDRKELETKALKALEEFQKEMTDKVIPEVVKIVEERRVLASESRRRPLKA